MGHDSNNPCNLAQIGEYKNSTQLSDLVDTVETISVMERGTRQAVNRWTRSRRQLEYTKIERVEPLVLSAFTNGRR